jgi:hypothetical protein
MTLADWQSDEVWGTTLSLCSWHAKRAVKTYLGENNQHPLTSHHHPPNYQDRDRERKWDIDLDSVWMTSLIEASETAFRTRIRSKNPGVASNEDAMEAKIMEESNKKNQKQICVPDKAAREKILALFMSHLHWHPMTHLQVLPSNAQNYREKVWRIQVNQMHELCKELCEAWAWEYLWKNWYPQLRLPF